jgi:glycosyltransferase involved in cell wall biosynthesis
MLGPSVFRPWRAVGKAIMNPLYVVHLLDSLGSGGAERLLHTNLKYLDPCRVRSLVVTVFKGNNYWEDSIRDLGVPTACLDCRGPRDLPAAISRLYRLLSRERPNLLHTHLWTARIIGRVAGRLSGLPVVSSIHNLDHEPEAWHDGADIPLWKRRVMHRLDGWTSRQGCERLIAVSDYVRQSVHRHLRFPLDRIDVLYNPIDQDQFVGQPSRGREELFLELGLPTDSQVILSVGRVAPEKGLLHAIRALALMKDRFPNCRLVSVGGTRDRRWVEFVRAEARRLGVESGLHILGERRDVHDLLRACDVFVFPSLHEGLGMALIEAMAVGCPCVATRIGPLPEVISHGVDGWLVAPGDAAGLADAICLLLADSVRRAALGQAAKESVQARFLPEAAVDRLVMVYEKVVRPRAPAWSSLVPWASRQSVY